MIVWGYNVLSHRVKVARIRDMVRFEHDGDRDRTVRGFSLSTAFLEPANVVGGWPFLS